MENYQIVDKRKPQTYRKPDFSVLRRGYEGHCWDK
nr:MAG TPA: hypothetical protein [Bacteriophage sp.]